MLIGHLPTGYLAVTAAPDRSGLTPRRRRAVLLTALAASVAPDVDVLAFYATGGQVHHHAFPTHWPSAWLAATVLGLGIAAVRQSRWVALLAMTIGAATFLHLSLDSIAGAVRWGAPWSDAETTLVEVPARYEWWVTSMVLHWTFGVEVALSLLAGAVAWRRSRASAG